MRLQRQEGIEARAQLQHEGSETDTPMLFVLTLETRDAVFKSMRLFGRRVRAKVYPLAKCIEFKGPYLFDLQCRGPSISNISPPAEDCPSSSRTRHVPYRLEELHHQSDIEVHGY